MIEKDLDDVNRERSVTALLERIDAAFFSERYKCEPSVLLREHDWEFTDLAEAIKVEQSTGRKVFDVERFRKSLRSFTPKGASYILGYYIADTLRNPLAEGSEYLMYFLQLPSKDENEKRQFISSFSVEKKILICKFIDHMAMFHEGEAFDDWSPSDMKTLWSMQD
jgi:hypothetical protein